MSKAQELLENLDEKANTLLEKDNDKEIEKALNKIEKDMDSILKILILY